MTIIGDFKAKIYPSTLLCLTLSAMPLLVSCSDDDGNEAAGADDEPAAMTIDAVIYSGLVSSFYEAEADGLVGIDVAEGERFEDKGFIDYDAEDCEPVLTVRYTPKNGIVLDEARPNERVQVCESFDLARQDFELFIPSEAAPFVSKDGNSITVAPGDYGTVKFSRDNTEGAVARLDVRLRDLQPYTVYYKPQSALGENYADDENLTLLFSPGDVIDFDCPKCEGHPRVIGVVYEVSHDAIYVVSDSHRHQEIHYEKKDPYYNKKKKKWVDGDGIKYRFDFDCPSEDEWRRMRRSWSNNYDLFKDSYQNCGSAFSQKVFYYIMSGMTWELNGKTYVCVEGDGISWSRGSYWFETCMYSWMKRIKISDLSNGSISVGQVRSVFRSGWTDEHRATYYITAFTLNRRGEYNIWTRYPKY